jgi:hypothetical protein
LGDPIGRSEHVRSQKVEAADDEWRRWAVIPLTRYIAIEVDDALDISEQIEI